MTFSITPFFRWFDLWVGVYVDSKGGRFCVCPVPTLGVEVRHRSPEVEDLLTRTRRVREELDDLLDLSSGCTGISAAWCPVCGDCACPDRSQSMNDDACPLHAPDSIHAKRLS